jgi:hypothetical protein
VWEPKKKVETAARAASLGIGTRPNAKPGPKA